MRAPISTLVAALVLLLAAPAAAPASIVVGATSLTGAASICPNSFAMMQTGNDPATPSYAMPTAGVVTHLDTGVIGPAGSTAVLQVLRGAAPSGPTVVGQTDVLQGNVTSSPVGAAVRIPVQAGDRLGLATTTGAFCVSPTGHPGDTLAYVSPLAAYPTAGSVLAPLNQALPGYRLNVAATLEADADGDGYGDDTQDSCPAVPAVHTGTCNADLSITQSAPAGTRAGDVVALTFSIANAGPIQASAPTFTDTLPDGLTPTAVAGGDCGIQGATVSCALPTLPSGAHATVIVVATTASAGTFANTGHVAAPNADPDPTNNSATANIAVTGATVTPPPATDHCVVPKVTKQPLAVAKLLLKAARCGTGKVTKSKKKPRRGQTIKVTKQGTKAGTSLAVGAKVALTTGPSR